jgi:hypothetical protein
VRVAIVFFYIRKKINKIDENTFLYKSKTYYSYNEDYFTYILPTFIFPNRMRDVDSMCVIPKHEELM